MRCTDTLGGADAIQENLDLQCKVENTLKKKLDQTLEKPI